LKVSVNVDFDNAIGDCLGELLVISSAYWGGQWIRASAFELPEPPWKTRKTGLGFEPPIFSLTLGIVSKDTGWLGRHILVLVLGEQLRVELDVAWRIHAMHISETGGDWEIRTNLWQGRIDLIDILRLGIERVIVDILVIDTILLSPSDPDLHFKPLLHRWGPFKILITVNPKITRRGVRQTFDVVLIFQCTSSSERSIMLFKISVEHHDKLSNVLWGEKGFAVELEVSLVGIELALFSHKSNDIRI
jgi:hypothetical protein